MQVTMKEGGSTEDKFIRNLHKGDFFGEKALSGEEVEFLVVVVVFVVVDVVVVVVHKGDFFGEKALSGEEVELLLHQKLKSHKC